MIMVMMIMIILNRKNKNITLKGNEQLEIIAEKNTLFNPGGSRANQAFKDFLKLF